MKLVVSVLLLYNTLITIFKRIITYTAQKIKTFFYLKVDFVNFYQLQTNYKGVFSTIVILSQKDNRVGVYIHNQLATVFENQTIEEVVKWINKNLSSTTVHILDK